MKPDRAPRRLLAFLCLVCTGFAAEAQSPPPPPGKVRMETSTTAAGWPPIAKENRPWTRWWWMGSAVSEAEITRQLEGLRDAGFGGVEITPIYGVSGPGEEERTIPFLSPRWMQMFRHTLRETGRLDLGVDMITGTGWPFGGPWVSPEDAPARVLFETFAVSETGRVAEPIRSRARPEAKRVALMAYGPDGQTLDLTEKVDASGTLDWAAPAGSSWSLHAAFQAPTGQQVKRAAPGAAGNVLDYFSGAATRRYLSHFDAPLAQLPAGEMVRSFFNDSYEVFGADWTPALFAEFERRRGYDLRRHLPALRGEGDADLAGRVRSDYRQTVHELLLGDFTKAWTEWAHGKGALARNQAHGSPGNLLDLYAAVDIPETEVFGPAALDLVGLEPLPGTPTRGDSAEEALVCKMASSAAHVAGKPLCSSESFTWLGEHGKVPLEHARAQADLLFVLGINHVFFHGTPFSPQDAAWPGWLFYASTHFGPTNPFWRDLPALNAYIARCQSFLQRGRPDNDVLLYFPVFDLWAQRTGGKDLLRFLTVGNTGQWLREDLPVFTQAARRLWDRGYGFDCVSDGLLADAVDAAAGGELRARGGSYRVLVVAGCTRMPPETLERLVVLAREGATVLVLGDDLPQDVPGRGDLEKRRRRLREAVAALGPRRKSHDGISRAGVGQGQFLFGPDLDHLLEFAGVRREPVVDEGVEFIRRRGGGGSDDDPAGRHYFLTNPGHTRLDGWVTLALPAEGALLFDPMHERRGAASVRRDGGGRTQVYLQMEPGESLLLRTLPRRAEGPAWEYRAPAGTPLPLAGAWQVEFLDGGPALPAPVNVPALTSWTEWAGGDAEALRAFSGTARYTTTFDRPAAGAADAWALDLGTVCHSARVRLNGRDIGTLIARPFRLSLPAALLRETGNVLEVEVTNLMANRLADLDRRGVEWRRFFFVNIAYKPFDASGWEPLPSGLLGPVALVPLRAHRISP